tara:strand:+ start:7009 stop:7452 length:444 start_codon:yes stop_codon:yes gene_type:complete
MIIQHAPGAPGLRLFGMGPNLRPQNGLEKLKNLFNANTSWAKHRNTQSLRAMLSQSEVVVSAWEGQKLIGFGRATTDQSYRAVLWDVVVEENYQKCGIGKQIVESILNNPLITKAEKVYIMTTHCEDFYNKMGFLHNRKQNLMVYYN